MPKRTSGLARLRVPGQRPLYIKPLSRECFAGCGVRIEPGDYRLRLWVGGRVRDYHPVCAERLGVKLPNRS